MILLSEYLIKEAAWKKQFNRELRKAFKKGGKEGRDAYLANRAMYGKGKEKTRAIGKFAGQSLPQEKKMSLKKLGKKTSLGKKIRNPIRYIRAKKYIAGKNIDRALSPQDVIKRSTIRTTAAVAGSKAKEISKEKGNFY